MNPEITPEAAPGAERDPFWDYGDLVLFIGASLPSLALTFVVIRAGSALLRSNNAKTLAIQILAYLFLLAALYAVVTGKYRKPFWASLGWSTPARNPWVSSNSMALLLAGGPLLTIVLQILGVAFGLPPQPSEIEVLITSRAWLFTWMLLGVAIGPAFEETVFRGFLFPLLARTFGAWPGIVLTAIPFGLMHGAQNHWEWQPVVLIALAGCVFGWVRYRTGSTTAAFVLHAAYNATGFAFYAVTRWATLK